MFNDKMIAEYLRRSYFAADGLWFVKVEESTNFDEALRIDAEVWRVLSKIQARKAKQLLGIEGSGMSELIQSLQLKFTAEGYEFTVTNQSENDAEIELCKCPWLELLEKSNREDIAATVADAICPTDLEGWAKEFSSDISVEFSPRMCDGEGICKIKLQREKEDRLEEES